MRPRFRGPYPYRRSRSSRRLPLRSTRRFRRRRASLGTPALAFDRCTAPVKLPARRCPRIGRRSSVRTRHWALDPTSPARKTAVAATERPRYKVLPSKPGRECDKVAMRLPHLQAIRLGNYRFSPSKVRQVTIARLAEPVSAVPELSSS